MSAFNEYIKTILNALAVRPETDMPTPTTNDAGAFLRVSANGEWVLESLTDVSEVGM